MRKKSQKWPRGAGRKPVREMGLVLKHRLANPNTANALVAAMALRNEGVTQPQIIAATGAPHRNKIKQLVGMKAVRSRITQDGRVKHIKLVIRQH